MRLAWIVAASLAFSIPALEVSAQGLVFSQDVKVDLPSNLKIKTAQRLLKKIGEYDGPINGQMTSATLQALKKYKSASNAESPEISDEIIARLRRSAWQIAVKEYRSTQDAYVDAAGMREIQRILKAIGYDVGSIDGIFGPGTMTSIENFQDEQSVTVDGLPTRTVLMNLKRAEKRKPSDNTKEIRILNWPDYIAPEILEQFEAETKIKVIYDTFDSLEALDKKIQEATVPYDVIVPTGSYIPKLLASGSVRRIETIKLENYLNIDTKILSFLVTYDPDLSTSVPYLWGTTGIGANKKALQKVGASGSVDSLKYIFDPQFARRLGACGVKVIDSAADIIPLALIYLGIDPSTQNRELIGEAEKLMLKIKQWVKPISSTEYIDALRDGKICIALGYSGDVIQARKAAENKLDVEYSIPNEGGVLWFDTMAIPSKAKNIDAAHKFIDFMLRPRSIAAVTNFVSYANANAKSGEFIDPAILQDKSIYPSENVRSRLTVIRTITPEMQVEYDRIWEKFKE